MKNILKIALIGTMLAAVSACTGTTYNKEKTCGADYLIHPVISIPAAIGACKG